MESTLLMLLLKCWSVDLVSASVAWGL